jgi:hypothetical protein
MRRILLDGLGVLAILITAAQPSPAQEKKETSLVAEYETAIRPLERKYCANCHGAFEPKGGIDLASRKGDEKPHLWKDVWQRLRSRQMPPAGKPQPSAAERERMLAWIERVFAAETLAGHADPGPLSPIPWSGRADIHSDRR